MKSLLPTSALLAALITLASCGGRVRTVEDDAGSTEVRGPEGDNGSRDDAPSTGDGDGTSERDADSGDGDGDADAEGADSGDGDGNADAEGGDGDADAEGADSVPGDRDADSGDDDAGPSHCTVEGQSYRPMEPVPTMHPCQESCYCGPQALVICEGPDQCPETPDCVVDGERYPEGAVVSSDECMTCVCREDALVCDDSSDSACPKNQRKCTDLFETGPCLASMPVWWHNPNTGTCETRVFGGCGGNTNRYESAEDCAAACRAAECGPDESFGVRCVECGVSGGCAVEEAGCFPACNADDELDCSGGEACVDGVCSMVCF